MLTSQGETFSLKINYKSVADNEALGERKYKKSLETDTTEVERKSDAEVSVDSDGDCDDVIDNHSDKNTNMSMKLLNAKTVEEDLNTI